MIDHPRYHGRTVEWGHWGITFMDIQKDLSKNFGEIVGTLYFPVSTRGPFVDHNAKMKYLGMCCEWIDDGILPDHPHFEKK